MTVVDVRKDMDRNAMTIVAEYPAPPARVWRLWADPRQLERWWGPPTYPATVTEHDLTAGGTVRYFMTSPEGQRHHGGWRVLRADEPHALSLEDFFADEEGNEQTDLPGATMDVAIEEAGAGTTRMTIESRWDSPEAMATVLEMGMEEGIQQALGQIEALLAEQPV
jgi:uncharacterized protein YndB with AHSA1/START domain